MLWASKALRELDTALLTNGAGGAERAELRAAGVSEARIATLYPFDIRTYRRGVRKAFSNADTRSPGRVSRLDSLHQGFHLAQVQWTLSRWLPHTTSLRWEAEITSASDSARTRARATPGGYDPYISRPRAQLLTDMYLLPGLLHELGRYPFENEQWNDSARAKLEAQSRHLRTAAKALLTAAQSA